MLVGANRHRVSLGPYALLSKGPLVCEDLSLHPTAYRITCIPFDVYKRLAGCRGWGTQRIWAHFEGCQVTPRSDSQ